MICWWDFRTVCRAEVPVYLVPNKWMKRPAIMSRHHLFRSKNYFFMVLVHLCFSWLISISYLNKEVKGWYCSKFHGLLELVYMETILILPENVLHSFYLMPGLSFLMVLDYLWILASYYPLSWLITNINSSLLQNMQEMWLIHWLHWACS